MKAPKRQDTNTEEKNIDASAHDPRHLRFRNLADMPMSLPTVNHALLHSYLNVESPDEIARLAAVMTSTLPEAFDAKGLVRAAVALRQEATAYVMMTRKEILRRMSPETLVKLTSKIELEKLAQSLNDDNWSLLHDPLIGPVLERLLEHPVEATKSVNWSSAPEVIDNAVREAIEKANQRTSLRLPFRTTCTMEEALRYAADEPTAEWGMLERAFREFWVASPNGWMSDEDAKETFKYQGLLIRNALHLAELSKDSEFRLQYLEQNDLLSAELVNFAKNSQYRELWVPGSVPLAAALLEELERAYSYFWPEPDSLEDFSLLRILSYDFHAFWKTHRSTYEQIYSTEAKEKKVAARAEKNRATAPQKNIVRDRKRWVQRTKDFIASEAFRSLADLPGDERSLEVFSHAAESHLLNCSNEVKKSSELKHRASKRKVQGFLGLLFSVSHSSSKTDIAIFCRKLKNEFDIDAMDSVTVEECSHLLEAGLASRHDAPRTAGASGRRTAPPADREK